MWRNFDMKWTILSLCLVLWSGPAIAGCNTSIVANAPDSRFVVDAAQGTVLDSKTGLMWNQCSEGQNGAFCLKAATTYTWQQALNQVQTVNTAGFAGYSDWRLPNIKELQSLLAQRCIAPAINTTVFPNTVSQGYWSATPNLANSNQVKTFDFLYGWILNVSKTSPAYIRLVRGGK